MDTPLQDCTDAIIDVLNRYMRKSEETAPKARTGKIKQAEKLNKRADNIIQALRSQKNGLKFSRLFDYGEMENCTDHSKLDIVLCALPHTPETVGLLNRHRLGLMKPDAVLVNGGRGSLIDQDALCELLQAGHFWGVGLEVTNPEPLPKGHPLWDQPRLMITPHAAGNSFGPGSPLERKIWDYMIRNVTAYLRGMPIKNQIACQTHLQLQSYKKYFKYTI